MKLTDREIEIMQHATAWTHERNPLYRNRFFPGGSDVAICKRLAQHGLMRPFNLNDPLTPYSVTDEGLARLLLHERAQRKQQ